MTQGTSGKRRLLANRPANRGGRESDFGRAMPAHVRSARVRSAPVLSAPVRSAGLNSGAVRCREAIADGVGAGA